MRVKNRMIKHLRLDVQTHQFKCPVYLCNFSHQNEDGLLMHYNSVHDDLVKLGLSIIKSKGTRETEKLKKLKSKANKIYLNTE